MTTGMEAPITLIPLSRENMRTSVLVVAEQTALRAAVARVLVPLGYRVEVAESEKRARQLIDNERFAAAVVAPASVAAGELALLREVQGAVGKLVVLADDARAGERLATSFPEALVCASQPLEHEKLLAFLGSLTPPNASMDETASAPELLHFEGCTLDVTGRIFLAANRQEVALTHREFALLVVFVRSPGRVLSRAQLRNAVDGGSTDSYDRSIDMLVARLRRKIEPDAAKPQFIVTVPGTGYKFVPRVRHGETAPAPAPSTAPPALVHTEPVAQPAERRQLTVLSCQILGFAALAATLDPEDLDQAIGPVYAAAAEIIARFGGTMVRTLGERVLAYFGYPKAHENNAESAVRAALELVRAIGGIEAAPIGKFRARIGIATGMMVVGELISVATGVPTAVGEALHLARQMRKSAPADGVVIAASTHDLVGRFFHCQEVEPVVVEEGHEPAPAWRVVDEIVGMPRFDVLRREGMPEFFGREAEIERLSQCWSKVLRGSGQVILLTGEAGIGKSRLVMELEERLRGEPHATIRYSGSPHQADAPMSALLRELQRWAGFANDDTALQKLEKVQEVFAVLGAKKTEATALIAGLLGLPCEAPPGISQLSPQKRKERTFAALMARVESMASQQPVLAVVDVVQWFDPTSLEFLALLVERASTLRLLLLIIGRPEFVPPWPDHSYVTTLALSRLSYSDAAALIHQVAGDRGVPAYAEAEILSRAEGVPLFIEELTKSCCEMLSAGCFEREDPLQLSANRRYCSECMPATLQGLLLARLDRLDRGKEVAQAGAVIGREFSFELLRTAMSMDEPMLVSALDQLVTSGLVFRRGSPPQATFVFKHALVRDTAYNMLPRRRRRELHAGVARSYEEHFPETIETRPELLAYHCREAGEPIKAIGYLIAAAELELQRSATTEAQAHLAQARDLISALPENTERLQLELKLEITVGRTLIARRSYTAPETRETYRRARILWEALGDQAWLPLIIVGQWVNAWSAADHQSALKEAQELYAWGERNNEPAAKAVGHLAFAMSLTPLGDLVHARRRLEQGLRVNQFVLPGRQPFLASETDAPILLLSYLHDCLLLLGFPDQAAVFAYQAAALKPHQLYSRALAQFHLLRMHVFERDAVKAAEIGAAVLSASQEHGYPYFIAASMVYTGWALAQGGDTTRGIELCQSGLAQLRTIDAKCWLPSYLALLAECYEQAGDTERGAQTVADALESVAATGERVWEAEIYRLKGRLLLRAGGDAGAAQACFAEALRKARGQKAKLLELRAATSLADLLKRSPAQAREALAPVYASFTEGFDSIDLREAKALLDSLSDSSKMVPRPRRPKRSHSAT